MKTTKTGKNWLLPILCPMLMAVGCVAGDAAADVSGGDGTSITSADFLFSIEPEEGATEIQNQATVKITFGQAMLGSSLTTHETSTCAGSIQLTRDNFASCIPIETFSLTLNSDSATAELKPAEIAGAFNHKVRLTTAIETADGRRLGQTYTQPNGFTPSAYFQCTEYCKSDEVRCVAFDPQNTELLAFCREQLDQCLAGCY